jgi:cell division transport system permease protein
MALRVFLEGLKNVVRSIWLSATAISVLTISLLSVVIMTTFSITVGYMVLNLDNLVNFPAFFRKEISDEMIVQDILPEIKSLPNVKEVKYFNRDDAKRSLEQDSNAFANQFIQNFSRENEALVWRYVLVTPDKAENYDKVVSLFKSERYSQVWEDVPVRPDFIPNLLRFYDWVRIVSIALISIFSLISVLVISNVLRMTIYSHKDEIEIMRLVGGTNNYIRGPFLAQGFYYTLIASLIVVLTSVPLINILQPNVENYIRVDLSGTGNGLLSQIYLGLIISILGSMVVSMVTVYIAIQRYLKL